MHRKTVYNMIQYLHRLDDTPLPVQEATALTKRCALKQMSSSSGENTYRMARRYGSIQETKTKADSRSDDSKQSGLDCLQAMLAERHLHTSLPGLGHHHIRM